MNQTNEPFELSSKTIRYLKEIGRFYVDTQRPEKEATVTEVIDFIAYEEHARLIKNNFISRSK